MGKGCVRRPTNEKQVRANWPFPDRSHHNDDAVISSAPTLQMRLIDKSSIKTDVNHKPLFVIMAEKGPDPPIYGLDLDGQSFRDIKSSKETKHEEINTNTRRRFKPRKVNARKSQ